jgi:glycosyltransferase involved in cell wall biosynthesis
MSGSDEPAVLFAIFQTGNRANGGVESITQVIESRAWNGLVVTQMETAVNQRWREAGLKVEAWSLPYRSGQSFARTGLWAKIRWIFSLFRTNWRIWRLLGKQRFSVVHCNDPAPFWHLVWGARWRGVPVVLNLRDTRATLEGFPVRRFRRRFGLCTAILVLSREMGEYYRAAVGADFLDRKKIPVEHIYSIVDTARMHPVSAAERQVLREQLGIKSGEFAIGYAAAFNDKKNQLGFIEQAGPLLRERLPAGRVHCLGDFDPERDPYARECRAAVERLALGEQVVFRGFTPEIARWYQALDALVVPTRQEGLARCMIEGLACGVPVVSFDVCSAREMLEVHDCGLVVKQGNYPDLVGGLVRLASDEAQRQAMGERGVATARQLFDGRQVAGEYASLYRRVAAGRP